MKQTIMSDFLINAKQRELDFLSYFRKLDYDLVDLDVIETFGWSALSSDDLRLMDQRHTWTNNGNVHTLRSDWTNAIVHYRQQYALDAEKIAYSGPVYKKSGTVYQLGVEAFTADIKEQQQVLREVLDFTRLSLKQTMSIAVISHNKLLKKLLTKAELADPVVQRFISERNKDALSHILSPDHPIIGLMDQRPENQIRYLKKQFPELEKELFDLHTWEEELRSLNIEYVYIDTLALPAQSYYKGIFIQLYQKNTIEPIASGGQYTSPSKAFGLAINL